MNGTYFGVRSGFRQGKIILVQLRDQVAPETGEKYIVKHYASEQVEEDGGNWPNVKVILTPFN